LKGKLFKNRYTCSLHNTMGKQEYLSVLSARHAPPGTINQFKFSQTRPILANHLCRHAAVHCDPISVSGPHLTVRVEGTRLGHTAIFQCPMGFKVNGAANLTCQASGESCLTCTTYVFNLLGTGFPRIP
jgi:hypothetical protein